MIQITEPIAIAPFMPCTPVSPVTFKQSVENNRVAIAIPDTGLLLLPTIPTILDETVAKKKPNNAIITAPSGDTGISGNSQIAIIMINTPIPITRISRSASVRTVLLLFPAPFMPLIASANVLTINGRDLIKLMIPPAATAPAPMYRI